MKKFLSLTLAFVLLLGLVACGGNDDDKESAAGSFQVGFGEVDITPQDTVYMGSFAADETSYGVLSTLMAQAMVMRDADGTTMVMIFADMGTISNKILNAVRPLVEEKYGIPKEYVTISCAHNHSAPSYNYAAPYDQEWKEVFDQGCVDAVGKALEDLAPATIEIGRTETQNLTFVRRYYLSNGGMTGDNYNYEHGDKIVAHESEADEEVQMVRFVREGDKKDVMLVNWQSHGAKHGHTRYVSSDYIGPLRDKVASTLGVHCMYFQGAAGNLNPVSRIDGECPTGATGYDQAVKHGEAVAQYVIDAVNTEGVFKPINSGKVRNNQGKFITDDTWGETNAITVGDLSFVTFPAEFFDTLGMMIKKDTPYKMTVLMGYSCGSDGCYLPDTPGFKNGGYEANKSLFRVGDGERFVQYYLDILNTMHKEENP